MSALTGVDRRGKLTESPFAYRATKDGKAIIYWQGRQVTVLGEKESKKFLSKVTAADEQAAQLLMAKATGNFKHGNER